MKEQVEKAYAKINLSLDLTGIREDGYHLLRSVMHTVTLADTVTVCPNETGRLRVSADLPGLPENEKNLAGKAILKLRELAGRPEIGAEITIRKRIPTEAGLGGGSADAAAALRAVGRTYRLPDELLLAAAAATGADVPFCLRGGAMLCEGIGERLTPLAAMPPCRILIAKPLLGASTAEIYRAYDRSPTPRTDSDGVIKALTQGSFTDLCSSIGNALAKACASVTGIDPPTEALLRTLGAEGASLSGSGTAAFGLFSNARAARIAAGKLRQSGFSVYLASPQA